MTTTTESITNTQIRTLRNEAIAAGDYTMSDLCTVALAEVVSATDDVAYDDDGNVFATRVQIVEARAECARVIAEAEAQDA